MQVRRQPHDSGRAVGFTCIAFGLVLRRIPFQGGLSARGVEGNVALESRVGSDADRTAVGVHNCARRAGTEVAFGRSEHARVPVLGNDGGPVSRQVDRSTRLRCGGWTATGTAFLCVQRGRHADPPQNTRYCQCAVLHCPHTNVNLIWSMNDERCKCRGEMIG